MNTFAYEGTSPRRSWTSASAFVIVLLALSVPVAALVASSSAAADLNVVQVTIQPTRNLPYQYALTAYNSSGDQVASFYGSYPEAAFGLPDGTYLVTASATYQSYCCCKLCPLEGNANASALPAIIYQPPSSEYGYAVVKVTGPVQISIATKNSSELPLVSLPVHVSFFNGTAAAGAYVSAYVVGTGYSYSPSIVSYGQTGDDGNFTLVMPEAPVQVNAYLTVPVQLPENVTAVVPVEVGGQKVNVTVYWQPSYVGLSGQALILPPQKGADITLQIQQNPYPIYYGTPAEGGATSVTTVTSTTMGTAEQTASSGQQGKIAPFDPSSEQISNPGQSVSSTVPNPFAMIPLLAIAGLGAVVVAGVVLGMKRRTVRSSRP